MSGFVAGTGVTQALAGAVVWVVVERAPDRFLNGVVHGYGGGGGGGGTGGLMGSRDLDLVGSMQGMDSMEGLVSGQQPLVLSLGWSWWMAAASSGLAAVIVLILVVVGYWNPPERAYKQDEYVSILDNDNDDEDESNDYYSYLQRSQIQNLTAI